VSPPDVDDQATLRRVATLVAQAAPPEEVFGAVAADAGRLLEVDFSALSRYDAEGAVTIVGAWARTDPGRPLPVGTRFPAGGRTVQGLVFETGRPARIDDYGGVESGLTAELAREWGVRSVVGVPVSLEGRVWGVIAVVSTGEKPLPGDTEGWLAGFIELVSTAIANAQARVELRGFAEEQAALRRVAVLVARAAPPEEVFAAVATEVGRLLEVDFTVMGRYHLDGSITIVAAWAAAGGALPAAIGTRVSLGGRNVSTLVFETGRPARLDDFADGSGPIADLARDQGIRASVGAPISVEGRLWGVILAVINRQERLPAGTEAGLVGFTELVATAIADAQARIELRSFAEEQAALRRVAVLVARAAPPEEVFAAVAAEAGRLLEVDFTLLGRYDPDGSTVVVGGWARGDSGRLLAAGTRLQPGGRNLHTMVFQTGRPARIDDYGESPDPTADVAREWGVRSAAAAPISVEGRPWGVISVALTGEEPLPADTEVRLTGFTELVGTALANAEAQAALTASRERIVAATDDARRRIERDLHDGAQQQLVSLALQLRAVRTVVPPEAGDLAAQLDGLADGLTGLLDELRDVARGIHPAALAKGGLSAALKTLAQRSVIPVRLEIGVDRRLSEPIELAAYYVVAEALTNAVKHAHATVIDVEVAAGADALRVRVSDDGQGGADVNRGSGLMGLTDRVETLGGRISLRSPAGGGTVLEIALPLAGPSRAEGMAATR
jgi:GAF domain-containing protein